jgi:hypothetical protein
LFDFGQAFFCFSEGVAMSEGRSDASFCFTDRLAGLVTLLLDVPQD